MGGQGQISVVCNSLLSGVVGDFLFIELKPTNSLELIRVWLMRLISL